MNTALNPSQLSIPQRWFLAALCVLFVGLSVQYSFKVREGDARSAFLRWRIQVLDLDNGVNIYDRHNYPNPPIMALVLMPLLRLPVLAGSLAWFYLKAGMAVLSVLWAFRLVETPDRPFPAWAKAVALLLSLRPIMGDLSHGNVNLFILFLVMGSLLLFCRRREWSAGLLLGLAIACKVTPALLVPYFLWKRAWKTAAATALGLVLFLVAVPSCFFGVGWNAELLDSWVHKMIVPYAARGEVTSEHPNQSLPGVLFRLASSAPSFTDYEGDELVPLEFHNVVDLDPLLLGWIVKLCSLAFVGLVVWTCRTPTAGERQGWRLLAEFGLVVLGMLMFSERTWKHHYVTMILPVAVLAYYLAACQPGRRLRLHLIGTMVLVAVLMALTSTSLGGHAARVAKLAQVYGAYLWANLLMMAAMAVLLRYGRVEAAEEFPEILQRRVRVFGTDEVAPAARQCQTADESLTLSQGN